ncbi:MAG TPA: pyridoxal phosphate-dependent aminotransferase [Thermomicrobiaceae bacterium]|nr:pyridoxal phosphate-dependent aminotransferase [Thermomicrobiaceae bacterium]
MKVRSQQLSDFFNIGRDLGWDVQKQVWTVNQLVDPEGRSYTLGDIIPGGLPPELPLVKSGNRYGYPPLRERIVQSQEYNLPIDNVLVTMGTQMSNFLAFAVALEPGDEAIIETPSWEQPKVLCEPFKVEGKLLRRRPELDWRFDLDELESLASPRTKLIYLCHPNNPTGATLNDAELTAICNIADRYGAYVVSDEIYRGLEWSGETSPSVANLYERGVTTSSVSKTLGMSGLRLGWLATPDRDFLERCLELKYYITLHQQSRLDETVALAALEPSTYRRLVSGTMDAGRANYEVIAAWMKTNGVFSWVPPAGGFLSFPHYDLDISSWDLCIALLNEPYRTYLIPGICYGYENHVRLGFGPGTPTARITDGLRQIDRFVADYRAGDVAVP